MLRHELTQILQSFLIYTAHCPSRAHQSVPMHHLIRLAEMNKVEYVLTHYLDCETCCARSDKKIIQRLKHIQMRNSVLSLVFEQERLNVDRMLRRIRRGAILLKQYKKRVRVGTDMDLLMFQNDIPRLVEEGTRRGYVKTAKVRHKEIQLRNSVNRYKLDVHHLIAFPMYGGLSSPDQNLMRRFTKDLLLHFASHRAGTVTLPIEWYIVSRIIHYWYNDLLCSLYPLFEISSFCSDKKHDIDWRLLFSIAEQYFCRNELIFVLMLAQKIVRASLPKEVERRISMRLLLARACFNLEDIVIFPPVSAWNHKRYRSEAQRKYRTYFFVKLLVNQKIPFFRLIRPQILLFIARRIAMNAW